MAETRKRETCAPDPAVPPRPATSYDDSTVRNGPVRASRYGKRRAWVLIGIHVAFFLHLWHWLSRGETVSPVEPSETMYTLASGAVNAGAILFAASILATLVLGRWFCGWACHLVALQDFCGWLMKKVGIRPRPLRSRLLMFVPLLACVFMFGQPIAVRAARDLGSPEWSMELEKSAFWETMPGFWIGLLTFLVCGFVMVYLLGAKGFCTYACPYGGIFGVVDKLAPGRIRVTDACKACGHCTAACTSNVQIHREVLEYGMVVDPGCMKCKDCISVCPENALYYGFGKPALGAKPKRTPKKRAFGFSLTEELGLAAVFVIALAVYVGFPQGFYEWSPPLYGVMPLLFALGLAATTAFMTVYLLRLVRRRDLSFQGMTLKQDGKLRRPGAIFAAAVGVYLLFVAHSALVQYHTHRGLHAFGRMNVTREALLGQNVFVLDALDEETKAAAKTAGHQLTRAEHLGLFPHFRVRVARAGLALLERDTKAASEHLRRALDAEPDHHLTRAELAHVLAMRAEHRAAATELRRLVAEVPSNTDYRKNLVASLNAAGDAPAAQRALDDLVTHLRERVESAPDDASRRTELGAILLEIGRQQDGIRELEAAVSRDPDHAEAHYNLGAALLMMRNDLARSLPLLKRAAKLSPGDAQTHFMLGLALRANGEEAEALKRFEKARSIDPRYQAPPR